MMKSGVRDTIRTKRFIPLLVIYNLYNFRRNSRDSNKRSGIANKSTEKWKRAFNSNIKMVIPQIIIWKEKILEALPVAWALSLLV